MSEIAYTEPDFWIKHTQRLQDERDELRRKYESAVLDGDRLAYELDTANWRIAELEADLAKARER